MYDIILILILTLVLFNKDIYETFTNEQEKCYLDEETIQCDINDEKILLLEEKLKLQDLKPSIHTEKENAKTEKLIKEYDEKLNQIDGMLNNINIKIKEIESSNKKEENIKNDFQIKYENLKDDNTTYIINKIINIIIILFIGLISVCISYYVSKYIFSKIKIKNMKVEEFSLDFDDIKDKLRIEKLKKKYKI